jgi:hypothetical protein
MYWRTVSLCGGAAALSTVSRASAEALDAVRREHVLDLIGFYPVAPFPGER